MIKRALISVHDKSGLDEFAQGLADLGVEIVSSGGTSAYLEEMGIATTRIEEVTQVPELLGGRVKTLHPRIHAAILARRDQPDDLSALEEHEIEPFDLVCVNLYPFRETVARHGVREEDAVEVIDIGGPAMLRAAAKNFAHVAPFAAGFSIRTGARRAATASLRSIRGAISPPKRFRSPPPTRLRSRRVC